MDLTNRPGVPNSQDSEITNPGQNGNNSDTSLWESNVSDLVNAAAFCIVILFTVCGSLLILLSIARSKHVKLRIIRQCYTASLALGNLLMACVVMPVRIISFVNKPLWMSSTSLCGVYSSVFVFCCTVTVLSLTVMSIDRFFSIPRSAKYQKFLSKGRVIAISIALWLLAAVVSFTTADLTSSKIRPSWDCKLNHIYNHIFVYLFVSIEVLTPVLLMLAVHCRITKATMNHMCTVDISGRKVKNLDYSDVPTLKQESAWARVVIKITLSFIIFWIPRCIFLLLDNSKHGSIHEIADGSTEILTYCFGASLAILLASCSEEYKNEMMLMVCPFSWYQRKQHQKKYTLPSSSKRISPADVTPSNLYRTFSNDSFQLREISRSQSTTETDEQSMC